MKEHEENRKYLNLIEWKPRRIRHAENFNFIQTMKNKLHVLCSIQNSKKKWTLNCGCLFTKDWTLIFENNYKMSLVTHEKVRTIKMLMVGTNLFADSKEVQAFIADNVCLNEAIKTIVKEVSST